MNQDQEHLRLLSIFHYVVGGIAGLFACFPCIHLILGIVFVSGGIPTGPHQQAPPAFVGWLLVAIGGTLIVVGWTVAAMILLAGRFLARRTHYTFCFVVAAIECLFMPFGTVLGIFTIIVLIRPSVKALFQGQFPNAT